MPTPFEKIEKRLDDLETKEARIEAEEKEILATDQHILSELDSVRKNSGFGRTVYRFRFLISLLLTIGVALIWQGIGQISQTIPLISSATGALVIGLLILVLIDRLTRAK